MVQHDPSVRGALIHPPPQLLDLRLEGCFLLGEFSREGEAQGEACGGGRGPGGGVGVPGCEGSSIHETHFQAGQSCVPGLTFAPHFVDFAQKFRDEFRGRVGDLNYNVWVKGVWVRGEILYG